MKNLFNKLIGICAAVILTGAILMACLPPCEGQECPFPPANRISINNNISSALVGDELVLTAQVEPLNASQSVIWSIVDGKGNISQNGVLVPLSNGTVTVRAVVVGNSSIYTYKNIKVFDPSYNQPPVGVSLLEVPLTLGVGASHSLEAAIYPAVQWPLEWSVTGPAAIDGDGVLTATAQGVVTVRVAAKGLPSVYYYAVLWAGDNDSVSQTIEYQGLTIEIYVSATVMRAGGYIPTTVTLRNNSAGRYLQFGGIGNFFMPRVPGTRHDDVGILSVVSYRFIDNNESIVQTQRVGRLGHGHSIIGKCTYLITDAGTYELSFEFDLVAIYGERDWDCLTAWNYWHYEAVRRTIRFVTEPIAFVVI